MFRLRSKLVFLAGFAVGYYVGTGAGEERRRQLDDLLHRVEGNPTVRKLSHTVRRNVDEVSAAVTDRVTHTVDVAGDRAAQVVDRAGDRAADAVEPDGGRAGDQPSVTYGS